MPLKMKIKEQKRSLFLICALKWSITCLSATYLFGALQIESIQTLEDLG